MLLRAPYRWIIATAGVGLTGRGKELYPLTRLGVSPEASFDEHPRRPAASILMGEAVCGDADPPVLTSPPEVHQTRAQP
ncbi:MAG TPA: hypothetical protein P5131_02875 [Methanoculleus sp.]|nr:hypothetical protein [Methanoculleus sp.]